MQILWSTSITIESLSFDVKNEFEYENLKFLRVFWKKDTPKTSFFYFFPKTVCTVIYSEGG